MMSTITEKQINAWKWHSTSEVGGIVEDTVANVTVENYKRKVELLRVLRAAGFDDVIDTFLAVFVRNLLAVAEQHPQLAAEARAILVNLMPDLSRNRTYAREAEFTATH